MDNLFWISTYWSLFYVKKNRDFMMEKKGELTTQQIVLLIVLIASFAVILFFLFRLNLGKTTEKEVCHNSVIMRGSSVLPEGAIALDCKTSYICLTRDGTCEDMTKPQIEKVRDEDEVYEVLANEMADCWWMFGEGKIDYVKKDFISNLYCSICSQVAFDNSVNFFENRELNNQEFYIYLAEHNVSSGDISYLDYLFGIGQASAIEETLSINDAELGIMNLDKQHYIIMGIYSDVGVGGWIAAGAGASVIIAGALLLSPVTGALTLISIPGIIFTVSGGVAGGIGGKYIGTSLKGESENDYLAPTIIEVNSEEFGALKCERIQTLA